MQEFWKDVVGYEDYFMVSDLGRVYSKRSGKILKQHTNRKGYMQISTRIGGRKGMAVCFKVHRLVAEAFIKNPELKCHVNHIDSDRTNNRSDNLEWVTPKENFDHGLEFGNIVCVSPKKTVTQDQVDYIRTHCKKGCRVFGVRAIAKRLGIAHSRVVTILQDENYQGIV